MQVLDDDEIEQLRRDENDIFANVDFIPAKDK